MTNDKNAYINQLEDNVGKKVTLAGWLYNSRASGKIQFLIVRDGTGLCQCVVEKSKIPVVLTYLTAWIIVPEKPAE